MIFPQLQFVCFPHIEKADDQVSYSQILSDFLHVFMIFAMPINLAMLHNFLESGLGLR